MKTVEEMRALVKAWADDNVAFGETSAWSIAAEICERLEGHNRNISILLDEIRKAGGRSEIPPNLDAAARLGAAWSMVYSAAVQAGRHEDGDAAFSRLREITIQFETLTKGEENSDD